MRRTLLGLLLVAGALGLGTGYARGEAGWTGYGAVQELTPTTRQRFLVTVAVGDNPSGCRSGNTFYQDFALTGAQQLFDTLLQALVHGKSVRLYVTGRCELNGYAEITSVTIRP